ncbi:LETM1 and EF-hand domain-containing protein anon-60Da, mitochondrial [Oopsacas minuta]|uniref:Mitochondrial proton/calcium exchanger protein n=1 Tax=Oopsacas minuta TaxID=111878 RepID=A0AAV7JV17_9METZ|nr:LETM1 and EF-hand domain-containing protein anon-60Da, mitochondrial [Oopsacas minuta]
MSRLLFYGCREGYADVANTLQGLKHGIRSFSNTHLLPPSNYALRNNHNNLIQTTAKWARNIQTETQTSGSSIPPFQPPNGKVTTALSQAPPLPTQENILEQSAKVKDLRDEISDIANAEKNADKKMEKKVSAKPSIWVRIKNETLHYYHGFKLFFYEVKISTKFLGKILRGHSLTRREKRQLERTVADIFRLVPFSIFIILPFMEFLLPVAIKIFPGLLPSTFQTVQTKNEKIRAELKVKLEMSKFLRNTMGEMSVLNEKKEGPTIHEFVEFFEAIRERGENAHVDDVIRFSQLFRDEFTLDNMAHAQLKALCKLLMLNSVGTSALLRLQLNMCLRHLKADDNLIRKEGIDNMTSSELQSACQARGMRAVGMNGRKLKEQLSLWLNLHLDKQVPPSLLLLTQALTLKSHAPNPEGLGKTLSALPEEVIDHLEAEVAKTPKTKLETLRNEQAKIEEENVEHTIQVEEILEKQVLVKQEEKEKIPDVVVKPPVDTQLTKEDVKTLSEAVDKLTNIRESIADIKTEMEISKEKKPEQIGVVEVEPEVTKSKAEKILAKKVSTILAGLEEIISNIEETTLTTEHISTSDLTDTLLALKNSISPEKLEQIVKAIDTDSDGFIRQENLHKIINMIASEDTEISTAHVKQITELIDRELLTVKLKQQ